MSTLEMRASQLPKTQSSFGGVARLVSLLRDVLDLLRAAGMRGLILDLRFNPGGLLREAQGVADLFLPKGKLVVTTADGVVWQQLYSDVLLPMPRAGQSMRVWEGKLGGYMCRIEKSPTFRCTPAS